MQRLLITSDRSGTKHSNPDCSIRRTLVSTSKHFCTRYRRNAFQPDIPVKRTGAEDKFYEVLEEVPRVRKDLGEPPLVTPSSQIVGTQAVFNVLMGERYKMATKETKDVLSGKYGATAKPFNPEVQKKVIGEDAEVITCRPADLIPNELDTCATSVHSTASRMRTC